MSVIDTLNKNAIQSKTDNEHILMSDAKRLLGFTESQVLDADQSRAMYAKMNELSSVIVKKNRVGFDDIRAKMLAIRSEQNQKPAPKILPVQLEVAKATTSAADAYDSLLDFDD